MKLIDSSRVRSFSIVVSKSFFTLYSLCEGRGGHRREEASSRGGGRERLHQPLNRTSRRFFVWMASATKGLNRGVCSGCEVITRLPHVHFQKFSCVIVIRGETVVSANKLAVPFASPLFFFLYIYFVSVTVQWYTDERC